MSRSMQERVVVQEEAENGDARGDSSGSVGSEERGISTRSAGAVSQVWRTRHQTHSHTAEVGGER